MHCLLQLHLNHTPNIRSTANHPLLQGMGNDECHQRDKEQVPQRRGRETKTKSRIRPIS